jgi:alkylhydroperoxidase family enzyme
MQARMKNPAELLPDAMTALKALAPLAYEGGVPPQTLGLVHLRASQINGSGETDERLFAVSAWREAPYFTDAERAALALSEAMTRLSDREDGVPDMVWNEAARHYDEKALAALVFWIGTTNLYNRLNVTTRQPAGKSWD